LILFGLVFLFGVQSLLDPAKCTYLCDDPVCNALCSPLCEAPSCQIPERYSHSLVCETRCPPASCLDKSICPACSLKSNNDTNTVLCNRFCRAPACACSCIKPTNCPKPRCELMCEKHSCESSVTIEPRAVEESNNEPPQQQEEEAEPEAPETDVVAKKPKNKIANSHYYDDDDWEQVDESWAWVWIFFFGFFFFLVLCAVFFTYGDAPYYYYPQRPV
jgi:hypothetical protein